MHRSLAALLTAFLVAVPAAADSIDDYVEAVMAADQIPGVSIVVLRDGEVVKMKGYGFANLEHDAPATPETIYQSGSVGKQFTAAGILVLVQDGKLGLDDRLAQYFPDGPPSWHRITVRHLLTHTSGLKDYGDGEIDLRSDYSEDELLEVLKDMPIDFEPGTQWSYSNSGYVLLGILISKLAEEHWSEFLDERVFDPLGMSTASVISERDLVEHRAAGYVLDEEGQIKNQEWVAPTLNRIADGALYFSVEDLAAWEAALHARSFLDPESFSAWWTPVTLSSGTTFPYGFGWAIEDQGGHPLIGHGGSWQGFRTAIARYVDEGLTVVVLANLAQAQPETMAHRIAGLLEPELRRPDPRKPEPDPDPERTAILLGVLEAFSEYRIVPAMGRGLAETASGTAREAYQRMITGRRVAGRTGFRYLAEENLSARPIERRGDTIARIVYFALETEEELYTYAFRLSNEGRVIEFSSEERLAP